MDSSLTLWIIRGLPGSAKTFLANLLVPADSAIAADDYPGRYRPDGSFDADKNQEAHEWCLAGVERMMQERRSAIAVHNTFVQLKYMDSYLALARRYKYNCNIIHCEAAFHPAGEFQNVHNVGPDVIAGMRDRWQPWGASCPIPQQPVEPGNVFAG